jgi:hypothetical protein
VPPKSYSPKKNVAETLFAEKKPLPNHYIIFIKKSSGRDNDDDNLILVINIATIHMPRMLVEDFMDPVENRLTRACMVSFYPEFDSKSVDTNSSLSPTVFNFILDCSNSMKDSLVNLKKLALFMLKHLSRDTLFNVTVYGTDHVSLFPYETKASEDKLKKAHEFILINTKKTRGSTNLLGVMREYVQLRDVSNSIINHVLISDGHVSNQDELFQVLSPADSNVSRVFTCDLGTGSSNNSHQLKLIARLTKASYCSFDTAYQSKWHEKVLELMDKAAQPAAVTDIKIHWQNFDRDNTG